MFPCEYCETFKNTNFKEHLRKAAFVDVCVVNIFSESCLATVLVPFFFYVRYISSRRQELN